MTREWNAARYDALPLPHQQWGLRTIDRLALAGAETVLDAGCGTGRDAEVLLDRLERGRVIAVDGSEQMLTRLRERLAGRLDRVEVIRADLTAPLPVGPVDAVVSVAAFHWIHDHEALFANLAAVLRPGGRISTDCGGQGNIASICAAIDDVLAAWPDPDQPGPDRREPMSSPWNFAGVDDTRRRLADAGFTDLDVRLVPDPAEFTDPAQLHDYLRTVVLGGHLEGRPESGHERFVQQVADRLPAPVVDYVRLEITATRS